MTPLALSTYIHLANMDDVYAMELLQQSLIEASEREKQLILDLQAAQEKVEQWKQAAFVSKSRFQELDQVLEDEEVKTNAERLARQGAEELTRQHHAEVLEAKRKESTANRQCDAAESEVLRLQSQLSAQRSAKVDADVILGQLREDLRLAELNGNTTSGQLHVAKTEILTLQKDLGVAMTRISIVERRARDSEETVKKEHERREEAEATLSAMSHECKDKALKLRKILGMYNELYAEHSQCGFAEYVAAKALDTNVIDASRDTHIALENGDSIGSEQKLDRVLDAERSIEKGVMLEAALGTGNNKLSITTGMPAFPEPVVLRPAMASQVEACKGAGRVCPARRSNQQTSTWKCSWRLRSNPLHIFFRCSGRR